MPSIYLVDPKWIERNVAAPPDTFILERHQGTAHEIRKWFYDILISAIKESHFVGCSVDEMLSLIRFALSVAPDEIQSHWGGG